MTPAALAYSVLLLPLVSAAICALFLRRAGTWAATVSVLTATLIAAGALALAFGGARDFPAAIELLRLGDFSFSLGLKYDDLAALMLAVVGVVGWCVHVFSLGYMRDDPARGRYFGGLSIFMFSMVGIVLADNLFMMFIFWELVGFSSWLLINHYLEKQSAADAAKKAFIVNRVGDFGFLLGLVWCYAHYGTTNLAELAKLTGGGAAVVTGIPLLLFCGAVGKSAQIPLQVWLPDAMEGPTPVSALIHAATMVAAGIYMLCRINMLMGPEALAVIMWVGTATALYSALCAVTHSDIKKVLAYSTLSQLGFMVAAFGLGSVGAAMFHLTTHAFFKALLFLGAGSVIVACHHEQDIFKLGGLRRRMPLTFWTFSTGVAAIVGVPFLGGFFSKEAILGLAFERQPAVFALLALTAVLTALYMVRMWKLVFLGETRGEAAGHAHENGLVIGGPLVVLALLALAGGHPRVYPAGFGGVLGQVPLAHPAIVLITGLAVLVIGVGAALFFYRPAATDSLAERSPGLFGVLVGVRTSFDRAYEYYVAKVQQRFAMLLNFLEQIFLAGLIVRGLAGVVGLLGLGARALHVGNVNAYAYWFLLGLVVLWAFAAGYVTF